ncbi:phospho-2-dehydro-3-deoxyheptonate aldolase [Spirochaeta africana DSM 8902]|uniref:Phospho-2-dehydro-3-deoxyheptonate aldolase n=2 Tax=Spirochaeta TaxID=146 RepID=H9UIJ6_SPIAZ|nr:phospho-2-dehydro-3-deoxyheptonate aldolase [Spirochaeta africana DSM 8902]
MLAAMVRTENLRIAGMDKLVSPRELVAEYPLTETACDTVTRGRTEVERILSGQDDRMLAIVGPCSVHDPAAGLEYAERLAKIKDKVQDDIAVVMRVYFEKPRTKLGWRGLIIDPHLNGSYDIQEGLRQARAFLLQVNELGIPAGSEALDPIVPQYISDLLSWVSIGARTTESQTHREMASGLSMPVGFKNGTDGGIDAAVNAMASCFAPHSFIGIDEDGHTCVLRTTGNSAAHVILRGGRSGPNYHEEDVEDARAMLRTAGLPEAVVVDCSHGNSRKDHTRQSSVLESVVRQRVVGNTAIKGFMLESFLKAGNQPLSSPQELEYGLSITDKCIDIEATEELLCGAQEMLQVQRDPVVGKFHLPIRGRVQA